MKTVTSIGNNFIAVAILPVDTPNISNTVVKQIAFILHTTEHVKVVQILDDLIKLRNSHTDYSTEITYDLNDPLYGNIKFHKFKHSHVSIIQNYCNVKFVDEINLLKPMTVQLKKWIAKDETANQ